MVVIYVIIKGIPVWMCHHLLTGGGPIDPKNEGAGVFSTQSHFRLSAVQRVNGT